MSSISYQRFISRLGYTFADTSLLEQALTHRSFASNHNERLEFLGDSVLGMVVSELLFRRFPASSEGELTRMRALLVKGDTLAVLANELHLGDQLRLGGGELKSGGRRRHSILAGAIEAVIGAVFVDGGIGSAKRLIESWFGSKIDALEPGQQTKDPKSRLQEYLQAVGRPRPRYELVSVVGQEHDQTQTVACHIDGYTEVFVAESGSRRKAEQGAAGKALDFLERTERSKGKK